MPDPYGSGAYGSGTYGFGLIGHLVEGFRARARRRRPATLHLDAPISFTATATLTAPTVALQLSALVSFTATATLEPDTPELHLTGTVAMDNTATVFPSATLQLESLVPFTATAELQQQSVQLALSSTVGMVNTARIATSIKAQSTVSMTNRATLRATLALRAPISMSNHAALAPPAGANVTFVPLSINHTGTADVTAALQAVIDGAPNGDEIRWPVTVPQATYRIDGTLFVDGRFRLDFNGNGCKFIQTVVGGRERSFWSATNTVGLSWHGFTFRGHNFPNSLGNGNAGGGLGDTAFNAAYEAQHVWNLISCRDMHIYLNTATDMWGDFTYCANGSGGSAVLLTSGRIHHNTFARNGRQGCSFQGVNGVRFDHNNVDLVRRAMFDFEPNNLTQFVVNAEIDNNFFGAHRLLFLAASGGLPAVPFNNIDIHNNRASSPYTIELYGEDLIDAVTAVGDPLPACTYNHGASGVGATLTANADGTFDLVDGISIGLNRRIMVLNRSFDNGLYTLTDRGSTTTPWVLTRTAGGDQRSELGGLTRFARSGVTRAHTGWRFPTSIATDPNFIYGTTGMFALEVPEGGMELPALTRTNFRFVDNTTTAAGGTASGAVILLARMNDITITGNVHPMQAGRNMRLAKLSQCTNYVVANNTGAAMLQPSFTSDAPDAGMRPVDSPLYGLTFDDVAGATATQLNPQELALTTLPHMPFLRFVCDPGEAPSRYSAIVNRYRPYSYLLCMPADSTALKAFTNNSATAVAAYTARFNLYLDTFEDTVDAWESGNELGGGWTYNHALGKVAGQNLVAAMVTSAHNAVKARGKRSVVCLWENNWGTNLCGAGTNWDESPQAFSARLSPTVRHAVDQLLISWYPTQCTGRPSDLIPVADIIEEIESLHLLYPNAWIGFGELGLPNDVDAGTLAQAKAIANYYYTLDLDLPYFVGGYFWWYAQQDAVPVQTSLMFDTLQTAMGPPPEQTFPVGFAPGAGLPVKVGAVYPELDLMKAHGAKFVRLTYGWDAADATHSGTFAANTAIRDVITYCNNTIDLDVILTLGFSGTAPWQNHIYSYIPQYAACAVGCATFFNGTAGKRLLALELGNEQNHDKADQDVIASEKGNKYAELLIRVFDPLFGDVRSVNPNLDVIIGGLGGERETGNGVSSFQFTQDVHGPHTVGGQLITIGLLTHYDGWGSHPYSYWTLPSADTEGGWDNLKNIMFWFQIAHGATPPLWVTEFGWPTDEHLAFPALYASDCLDAANALSDVTRLLDMSGWDVRCLAWFAFINNNKPPGPGIGHDNYFGILEYSADPLTALPKPHLRARFSTVATRGPST